MIVGCYVLDLYCDSSHHNKYTTGPHAEFTDELGSRARRSGARDAVQRRQGTRVRCACGLAEVEEGAAVRDFTPGGSPIFFNAPRVVSQPHAMACPLCASNPKRRIRERRFTSAHALSSHLTDAHKDALRAATQNTDLGLSKEQR